MRPLQHFHFLTLAALALVILSRVVLTLDLGIEAPAPYLAHAEGPLLLTVAITGWWHARR